MQKLFLAVVLVLLQSRASACLWDRDTLANEAREFPDVVRIITGRFERNPPLYYEMRLNRVAAEVIAHPEQLSLYDDAAVADDRLGRDDQAIRWMDLKRFRLDAAPASNPEVKDHRYRYYANLGTFHAHHWIRAGADRKHLGEVKLARDLIAKALEINPNAHFGREKYQLLTLEWIIDPTFEKENEHKIHKRSFASYLIFKDELPAYVDTERERQQVDRAIKGLAGLIVLGNAWESIDIYGALAMALGVKEGSSVSYLAQLRMIELEASGKKSLIPDAAKDQRFGKYEVTTESKKEIDRIYRSFRGEADQWQSQRTNYMMSHLKSGEHPDTHSGFWKRYKETSPPTLPYDRTQKWFGEHFIQIQIASALITLFLGLFGLVFCFWLLFKWLPYKLRFRRE